MSSLERVIQIDFVDRLGLGMEIFERCEKNNVDKIGMEVIPNQGMFIKFRCLADEQVQQLIRDLEEIQGIIAVHLRERMPYEEREHRLREIISNVDRQRKGAFEDIAYQSTKMRHAVETAKMVAKGTSTVLLRGESGTGKELFARAIHMESLRAQAPFIPINCVALPDSLLESELFGYEEGSFTGAVRGGRKGLFEQADHGTLFLDEIGEISTRVQVHLLRVLQENKIRRVGGAREVPVDVRIIAATHRNLEEMIKRGEFREDLYYRLNVIPIRIPPLRERSEDIPLIAQFLIRKLSQKLGKPDIHLTKESMDLLMEQAWPGNVRQLENTLERLINVMDSTEIKPQLFYEWTDLVPTQQTASYEEGNFQIRIPMEKGWPSLKTIVSEVEKQVLLRVLETHKSSRKAGRVLGVSNTTILNKLKHYRIETP
ncbi:sigma 54-interacting transcriptional regulator [Desulfosporosinus sp. PR]|uniref:sigma 54-interacting transcriptional regulator n=1 Tax=Candidatus Desulfosporosinus nitrosoreducens TaxID=3401928 RepID=UPI0027E5CE2F|nr:sigma 54-interacting transcriptional regulator [Desulfosporosinus sp. PR]MDQ7095038.1 sigma 54-interacting transcriptional regulator [Desulfosporosinus sp. PR]